MFKHIKQLGKALARLVRALKPARQWSDRTLVVGPSEPVDGDSVASTKAIINHLRKQGKQAYTLPTIAMYPQIAWVLESNDYHPAALSFTSFSKTTDDLQSVFDHLLENWRPDEIILVDGPRSRLGFDPRGISTFTIDHHLDLGARDDEDAFIQPAASAGCLLIEHFGIYEPILAVSILTDTFWLRQSYPAQAARALALLAEHGLTDDLLIELQRKLIVHKDPKIITALHDADIRISTDGTAIFATLKDSSPQIHRGVMAELGYFSGNIIAVRPDGYASMRTNAQNKNLQPLAAKYGGGGHRTFAAAQLAKVTPETLDDLWCDFQKFLAEDRGNQAQLN